MGYRIDHFFHFNAAGHRSQAGLEVHPDHALLTVPEVSTFSDLIEVYRVLGQDGYFGNSLGSFQDCLNDCKGYWGIQPQKLDIQHLALPGLPQPHLEAYIEMLLEAVVRYSTHAEHNQKLDPEHIREELHRVFPSMSEAQIEFYIAPIPTTTLRVLFPESCKDVLQAVLDGHQHQIEHEVRFWNSKGFHLPEQFTRESFA